MAKAETKAPSGEDQSMEEILQSIRRIIAEENDGEPAAAAPAASAPVEIKKPTPVAPEPAPVFVADDVLELTDMVTEEGAVISLKEPEKVEPVEAQQPGPVISSADDDILKNIDAMLGTTPAPVMNADDSLLSTSAAEAAAHAFKSLKRPQVESAPIVDSVAFRSGTTVEDLMVELMRPMLKAWLDTNLPPLVERIVEREIKKLTQ